VADKKKAPKAADKKKAPKAADKKKAPKAADKKEALIPMVRSVEAFPEGPHAADVHPAEVENFAAGGWEKA
jgi:hypothetical protein